METASGFLIGRCYWLGSDAWEYASTLMSCLEIPFSDSLMWLCLMSFMELICGSRRLLGSAGSEGSLPP